VALYVHGQEIRLEHRRFKAGDPVSGTKTYYEELEMTIPVQSASN